MTPIWPHRWRRRRRRADADYYYYSKLFVVALSVLLADTSASMGATSPPPLCSFESGGDCPYWTFANSEQLRHAQLHHSLGASATDNESSATPQATPSSPDNNFYVVLSGGGSASNHYATRQVMTSSNRRGQSEEPIAMLVSPFFDRTAPQCELLFRYRLLGQRGAELLVATEQLSLHQFHPATVADSALEEDEDWTRPTLRARFEAADPNAGGGASGGEPWAQARIGIGTFGFPTRIRIECHPPQRDAASATLSGDNDADGSELSVECSVDDLELLNCNEELWRGTDSTDVSCPEGRSLCRPLGGGPPLCMGAEHICDMHPDCEEGEDELEEVHRCSQVPEGARCDFEDLRWPAGCPHWRFFSGQAGGPSASSANASGTVQHLVSLSDAQQRRVGIPPGEYFSQGRLYRPGHFLFFSSYDHHQSGQHDIVYSSAISPPLPRLSEGAQCTLRFFYCQTGNSPFQVFLSRRNAPQEMAKPLWAPPRDDHVREPCEWRRAAVDIHPALASGEYALKLSFAKLAGSMGSVAIDDLSLSPGCFANGGNNRLLPDRFSLVACDEDIASGKNCEEGQEEVVSRWTVSSTGEYRLELAGAAGGAFPGRENAWGTLLVANVRLDAGREIAAVLGRRGKCLCDGTGRQSDTEMRNVLCTHRVAVLPEGFPKPDELPGCGGGGASLLLYGGLLAAVAGGGGGDFPVQTVASGIHAERRVAGHGVHLEKALDSRNRTKTSPEGCGGVECMDGHIAGGNLSELRGGKCPGGTRWAYKGGAGGGGASCGAGGGGGGGYKGGAGGFLSPGQPGSSVLLRASSSSSPQIELSHGNPGPGRLLLLACPQQLCPRPANCTFAPPQPKMAPRALCTCPGGRQVPPNGSCTEEPSILEHLFPPYREQIPPLLLMSSLLLLLLSVLFAFLCCLQLCRKSKSAAHCADVHELIAIAAEAGGPAAAESRRGGCVGNRISGNPIYEPLLLSSLPQIPRHSLRLDKSIGHGAFGEVFAGYLLDAANGPPVKVAVKTLPVESARDFGDDFEMEARLLSQFKHDNIVTFFGISFEQQSKYIVLEFLEGGDLKNFLRENRPRTDQEPTLRMGDLLHAALDVARGCEHLEATRFIHRDIAARNCLLTARVGGADGRRVVKIADFGMARDIYRNDYYRKGGKAFLPVRWMPPESFLDGLFTSKTDVWAYGVLLWEIFSLGYIPYSGRENHEVMRLIVAGDRLDPPIGVPAEVYDVMLCCWNTDTEKRPRFVELVAIFEGLVKRDDLTMEPLPPIRHRLANERSLSATPSMSRAGDPHPASTTSQATVSTVLSSAPEGGSISTSMYESMPTAGDGVCRAVFPPYQTRQTDEANLMSMDGGRRLEAQQSMSSSSSSHDSTLHESAGTVKLRHCIRRPHPPLSLATLKPLPKVSGAPSAPSCPASASLQAPGGDDDWRRSPRALRNIATCNNATRNASLPPISAPWSGGSDAAGCDQDSGIASARSIASADAALIIELRRD